MACKGERINPSTTTRYRLYADSAGRCQNPNCLEPLFRESTSTMVSIAQAAHIIAASSDGARGESELTDTQRAEWSNLILLCANCHAMVDAAEKDYPVALLRQWKTRHSEKIDLALGIGSFGSRQDAYRHFGKFRRQNLQIFLEYGPDGDERFNPESEIPLLWRRHVRETILPNSRAMLRILDQNQHLLTEEEIGVAERFRLHLRDLEARHLGDSPGGGGLRFPQQVDDIFKD